MVYKMKSSKLFITCREATMFSIKREERSLSFSERIKLFIHLLICEFCRLFDRQHKFISLQLKNLHAHETLTDLEKDKMQYLLESTTEKK